MTSQDTEVWIMWHVPPGGDADKAMLIGAYSSKDDALSAVARLADKPGFRDYPGVVEDADDPGLFMELYRVGKDHWEAGYRIERDGEWWQPVPAWVPPLTDK
jgi:hypothetical protein